MKQILAFVASSYVMAGVAVADKPKKNLPLRIQDLKESELSSGSPRLLNRVLIIDRFFAKETKIPIFLKIPHSRTRKTLLRLTADEALWEIKKAPRLVPQAPANAKAAPKKKKGSQQKDYSILEKVNSFDYLVDTTSDKLWTLNAHLKNGNIRTIYKSKGLPSKTNLAANIAWIQKGLGYNAVVVKANRNQAIIGTIAKDIRTLGSIATIFADATARKFVLDPKKDKAIIRTRLQGHEGSFGLVKFSKPLKADLSPGTKILLTRSAK